MEISRYIDFQALSFGPGHASNVSYACRGDGTIRVQQSGEDQSTSLPTSPDTNGRVIWESLLAEPPLALPKRCDSCPDNRQAYFWRSFTDLSLNTFRERGGVGTELDLIPLSLKDNYYVDKAELESPGTLWVTRSPQFAMAVGVARSLTEDQGVHLLGVTVCECDLHNGVTVYATDVVNYSSDASVAKIPAEKLSLNPVHSVGEIISQFTQDQIQNGVAFKIDSDFFRRIKEAISASKGRVYVKGLAHLLIDIFEDMAKQDKKIVDPKNLNVLHNTWKPFLISVGMEVFLPVDTEK